MVCDVEEEAVPVFLSHTQCEILAMLYVLEATSTTTKSPPITLNFSYGRPTTVLAKNGCNGALAPPLLCWDPLKEQFY